MIGEQEPRETVGLHVLGAYIYKINQWGLARNITAEGGATALAQVSKLLEETAECVATLNKLYSQSSALLEGTEPATTTEQECREQLADDYGDMLVCIVQAVRLSGLTVEQCLAKAWGDIKDRKGTMVDGKFVKAVPGAGEPLAGLEKK